ncbi:MAG: dTDP-4-dehydrorhamnose reductase [Thiolinea sp.]
MSTADKKTVLITGADGQLGYELQKSAPANINIIATDVNTLDITRSRQISLALEEYQPDCIINGAAYTAVDKAEEDQETAYLINNTAPALIAQAITARVEAGKPTTKLIQISTDFVFDGQQATPYTPDTATDNPLGVYGASKLAGEQAVSRYLPDALIIRTSWLYSAHGHNFVKSMLRLMQDKDQLGIVYDQVGSPTWAATLADTIWALSAQNASGIYHCSDNGVASWYDFAAAIQEQALELGLLNKAIPLRPIRSSEYPTPAKRPAYSVMDKSTTETALGYTLPYWRNSLRSMLEELKQTDNT